jgi:hypothetical protein
MAEVRAPVPAQDWATVRAKGLAGAMAKAKATVQAEVRALEYWCKYRWHCRHHL